MDASQLFKAGQLAEAVAAQVPIVNANPTDHGQRLFLFELLMFAGDLDEAQRQIEAIFHDQPEIDAAVLEYRHLLQAERLRRLVFTRKAQPEFLAPPAEHVRTRLLALMKLADNAPAEAAALLQQANAQMPAVHGSLNGQTVEGLRDGDDRLGSVLEVLAHGHYYWVPLEQVHSLTMKAPRFPRDLFWIPAQLELHEQEAGNVFLSALYPETDQESDPQLKLGRLTDWRGDTLIRGVGAKTFFLGSQESSILDWRNLDVGPG